MDGSIGACARGRAWRPLVGHAAMALAAAVASETRGADVELSVARDGQRFEVQAQALMRTDLATAWATLTDYPSLPAFVPGIHRVHVVQRAPTAGGERLTVDYEGRFRLLFFVLPTRVRLDIRHAPPLDVRASSLPLPAAGAQDRPPALKGFTGEYHLRAIAPAADGAARVALTHRSDFELAQPLPPVVGPLFAGPALRHVLRRQLEAMAHETERRAAAQAGGAPARHAGQRAGS